VTQPRTDRRPTADLPRERSAFEILRASEGSHPWYSRRIPPLRGTCTHLANGSCPNSTMRCSVDLVKRNPVYGICSDKFHWSGPLRLTLTTANSSIQLCSWSPGMRIMIHDPSLYVRHGEIATLQQVCKSKFLEIRPQSGGQRPHDSSQRYATHTSSK
jgi:hypothetical protein